MTKVTLATGAEVETGCYVDGHWGQYGQARSVEIAAELGWDDAEAVDLAARQLASMGPSTAEGLADDEWESLLGQGGAADDAETYLNGITPDGYAWGWNDGEFFLWPMHVWAEEDSYADPCACAECAAERVANLPGAPLTWDGQDYGRDGVWTPSDTPVGGDSVPMGTLGMSAAGPHDPVHAWEFPVTVWGDYVGSTVERSNWRVLQQDYADSVIDVYGGYGSHYIAVPVTLASSNPSAWEDLAEMARSLENYPLINDEDHSILEHEMAEEAWDQYLRMDLTRDLEERGVSADFLDIIDEDSLREHYYRLTGEANSYPYGESADSIVFPCHASVCDQLAELILRRVAETADTRARFGGTVNLSADADPNQGSLPNC